MKLFFSILLIAFGLIILAEIVGVFFVYESKISLQNHIVSDASAMNRMLVNRIDAYVSERTVDMFNLVNDKSVLDAIASSNSGFQKMDNPRQFIETQNANWRSTPQNATTQLMKNIIESPTSDRLRSMMKIEKNIFHDTVFDRLLLANSFGADVAGDVRPDNYDQFNEPWYESARQSGLYIGNVTLDKPSGLIGIPIAIRVNDGNGNFVGVAKGVIDVDNIFHILSNQMSSKKVLPTKYELFDRNGTILYSSDPNEKPLASSFPKDFMQNVIGASGSFRYTVPNGTQTFVVYVISNSSKISPTANWILATEYDPPQMLKPVRDMTNLSLIIMFVIIPVVCAIVFWVSRRVERPLSDLMTIMHNFAKGNVPYLEPKGSEEVKALTSSFNTMIKSVTESEKKTTESERLYRNLFDSSPDPIRLIDLDGITIDVNHAFVKKFGYSKEESIGQHLSASLVESGHINIKKILDDLKKGSKVNSLQVQYRKKDGSTFPALLSATPFYDSDNKLVGYIGVINDVTELIEAKTELEEKEAKIESQYSKLVRMDKMKDEFSTMISHELTTPLFPIKFHASLLKDSENFGPLNEDQLNSVNEIYQNSERLEKLISDVLDVQKLELGELRFQKNTFKVNEFMNRVFTNHMPYMKNKQITFINSSKDTIEITTDADRLAQVFNNLIINSVDFVSDKTGVIEINAKDQRDDVLFSVKDNGEGIPKDKQENLFKKFYQIDTSPTRKHRGSGLGLSICKGIVEGLGGRIWLESTLGVGTVVYFKIPKVSKMR